MSGRLSTYNLSTQKFIGFTAVARPDWRALVKNSVTIILHGADDGTVAFRVMRFAVPDGGAVVGTVHTTFLSATTRLS
jgi:hypothetical protein